MVMAVEAAYCASGCQFYFLVTAFGIKSLKVLVGFLKCFNIVKHNVRDAGVQSNFKSLNAPSTKGEALKIF